MDNERNFQNSLQSHGRMFDTLSAILSMVSFFDEISKDVQDFGYLPALMLETLLPETRKVVSRIRRCLSLQDAGFEHFKALKESYTPTFAMIGVAGAIIAQIALTALTLSELPSVHWTAQACFVVGLVSGALSVFFSCILQGSISGLHTARDTYDWLVKFRYARIGASSTTHPSHANNSSDVLADASASLLRPSLGAAMLLTIPTSLLNVALMALLAGFGIYFGSIYANDLPAPTGTASAMAVFIVYIVCVGVGMLMFYVPMGLRAPEIGTLRPTTKLRPSDLGGVSREAESLAQSHTVRDIQARAAQHDTPLTDADGLRRLISLQSQQVATMQQMLDAMLVAQQGVAVSDNYRAQCVQRP